MTMQRKCWTSGANSCRKSKSGSSIGCFHAILLDIWSAFFEKIPWTSSWFFLLLLFSDYIFPISGKFGAFFASIPLPIFAAIYCVLYGLVGECSNKNNNLIYLTFKLYITSKFLFHQLLLESHLYNSQTIIPWEISTFWDHLFSLEYQYHNISSWILIMYARVKVPLIRMVDG